MPFYGYLLELLGWTGRCCEVERVDNSLVCPVSSTTIFSHVPGLKIYTKAPRAISLKSKHQHVRTPACGLGQLIKMANTKEQREHTHNTILTLHNQCQGHAMCSSSPRFLFITWFPKSRSEMATLEGIFHWSRSKATCLQIS